MRTRLAWMAAAAMAACLASGPVTAKTYTCRGDTGGPVFSDHACPVIQAPVPTPTMPSCPLTAEQRRIAERLEEQFLRRFPDEANHRRAQLADLQAIAVRIRSAVDRLGELKRERTSIDEELEFYKGKEVPKGLARRLDASEAKFAALADVLRGTEEDVKTVVALYECQRTQFAERWRGGAPGSSACAASCKTRA